MKRTLSLVLALCMALMSASPALAEDVATPNDIPAAETSAQPTTEPTAEPAAESTVEPTAEPSAEPSAEPTGDMTAPGEDTAEEATPAPEETAEPEATAEAPAADWGTGPMYVLENGFKHYGTPEELIPLGQVLYLYHTDVVEINGVAIDTLSRLSYALDPEVFTTDEYTVILSLCDPSGAEKEDTVFLWVQAKETAPGQDGALNDVPVADDEDVLEWEVQVIPADYAADAPCSPSFTLVAFPEIQAGMTYAVMLNGGDPVALLGDRFVPDQSGEYRFVLLDAQGSILGRSARYKVTLTEATASPATAEPTIAPTAVPAVPLEPTAAPTTEPDDTAEPAAPTSEPTAVPAVTAEPASPTASPMDDLIADMDAFLEANASTGEHGVVAWAMVDGEKVTGSLETLLATACSEIYIATGKTIVLRCDATALSGKTLLPDPDVFGSDYAVILADSSNSIEQAGALFVSVQRRSHADQTDAALTVTVKGSTGSLWTNQSPVFSLTAEPDLPGTVGGYSYAVSVDGGAPLRLSGSTYTAATEGEYALQFAIVDPDSTVVTQSDVYSVKLDMTAPLLQVSAGRDGTLLIVAGDLGSGAVSCSTDGGATWQMMTDQGDGVASCSITLTEDKTFEPGMIIVQDRAGNRTAWDESVTVTVQAGGMTSGMGSFGGIRGGSSRTTSHAASTQTTVTVYNGVELMVNAGSMTQLTMGGEMLELYLTRDDILQDEEQPGFTAELAVFDGSSGAADTLVLTAVGVTEENAGDYAWQFSGQVYKKLAASGIDYLVLRCGERVTALSTAGFTAGVRYSMFRAEGLPSKDFIYTLRMMPEKDIRMEMTVADTTWQLTDDPSAEIYYYDVTTDSADAFDMLKG